MAIDPLTQAFQAGYSYDDIALYHSTNGFDVPEQPDISLALTPFNTTSGMTGSGIEYAPGTPGGAPAPMASGVEYAPGTPGGAPAQGTPFNQPSGTPTTPSPNSLFNQPVQGVNNPPAATVPTPQPMGSGIEYAPGTPGGAPVPGVTNNIPLLERI